MKKNKRINIKTKFFLYGFRVFAPVLLLVAVFYVSVSLMGQISEMKKNAAASVKSVGFSINLIQEEMKKVSTYISINNDIRKILTAENVAELNENPRLWYDNAPMETLQNLVALKGNGDIKTLAIYPENGVRPFLRGMDGSVNHSTIDIIRTTKEYSFTNQREHKIYWMPVKNATRGTFEVNRKDKILLYREVVDLKTKKPLCFIAIGINKETFADVCKNSSQNHDEKYLIYNTEGDELCDVGNNNDALKIHIQRHIIRLFDENTDLVIRRFKNNYIVGYKAKDASSVVCKILPLEVLYPFIIRSVILFLVLLFFTLLTLYFLLGIMSKYITDPMQEISEAITKIAAGDFNQHIELSYNDEIGDVANAINKMTQDIQSLINENYVIKMKEKENEIASLQAQINPHFLYNTLNSLYWQAIDMDNDQLAENILSLSKLFQLVLSRGKQEVLVEDEFELITHYLEIQKMRFNEKMQYTIELDDRIRKHKFSKLLLQPFVENSIEHGFSNKTTECNLNISGKLCGDKMVFEISDTGSGMTDEELNELLLGKERSHKDRVGGYAIVNIVERIKLLYGEKGSFKIKSKVDEGTTVKIEVPFD